MKTKSTHRFTALVLAIVMLASVFTLPTFAEETQPKEPQVFAYVDFEDAENGIKSADFYPKSRENA